MKPTRIRNWLDAVIDKGIFFLLIFTPLALGSVQPWASAIMEIAAFIIFGAWSIRTGNIANAGSLTPGWSRLLAGIFGSFIALMVFQMIPLPAGLLRFLSPNTAVFYERFTIAGSAEWRTLSIYPWATRQELLKILSYAAVFLVVAFHYQTRQQTEALIRRIIAIALLIIVFAVVQKVTWNGRMYWLYPIEAHAEASRNFAVWGPYINRNHFAGYLEMCIPFGLGMLLYTTAKTRTGRHVNPLRRITSVLSSNRFSSIWYWSIASFVMIGTLFMTLSRGGIVGFLCSALFLFVLARMRRGLKRKIYIPVFAGLILLLIIIVAGWVRIEDRFERLGEDASLKRVDVWSDSIGMIKDYTCFGTGLGTFQNSYPQYQTHSSTTYYDHAHNDYIELFTDTGIIGFILAGSLAAFLFILFFVAWLKRHSTYVKAIGAACMASLLALSVHSFTDFNFHIPANAMLLAVVTGITFSVIMNKEEEQPKHTI